MNVWTTQKILYLTFLLKGVECLQITMPAKIDALNGSCVLINCMVEINKTDLYEKYFIENAEGFWSRNKTHKIVFNSNTSNPVYRGNIIGNLKEKNCTTIFYDISLNHSGIYYFTIMGNGKPSTFNAYVNINVTESPPKPTVLFWNKNLLEGNSVILRCSTTTFCSSQPPVLTWSTYPKFPLNESSRLQELKDKTELISYLTFTATHLHHRVKFTCTVTYQLTDKNKTAQNYFTLNVQYAPKISLSSSCSRTDVTVCFCEVHGNPSPNLTWYLSERPISNSTCTSINEEQLDITHLRSILTLSSFLTATPTLLCIASNIHGNASHHLLLPSKETAQCEHKPVSLLIVLALIVILYALTVGAGLYKIKQLSTKLKAKGQAESYASAQPSDSNNIYENIKM